MLLIVGLGNFGKKYENNRHNIGFMIIDALASAYNFPTYKQGFQALYTEKLLNFGSDTKVLLFKPTTFMNLSGNAVLTCTSFYKIPPSQVLVIYDDIDLAFSEIRYKIKSGHGGHNGIKDLQNKIGNDFPRIKIGIGRGIHNVDSHVLSDFTQNELAGINFIIELFRKNLHLLLQQNYTNFTKNLNQEITIFNNN